MVTGYNIGQPIGRGIGRPITIPVQVAGGSAFSPATIVGNALWHAYSENATVTSASNRASSITDKSGAGNTGTASGNNRPYRLADSGVGFQALNIQDSGSAATSQFITTTNTLAAHSAGGFALVYRPNPISGTEDPIFSIDGEVNFGLFHTATGYRFGIKGTTNGTNCLTVAATVPSSFVLITGRWDVAAGTIELSINGSKTTGAIGTGIGTVSGKLLIGRIAAGNDCANADIAEFVYYNAALTAGNITALETYENAKYPVLTATMTSFGFDNWYDASDLTQVTLAYTNNYMSSATFTGTSGLSTGITSVDLSSVLVPGVRLRFGGAGATTTANTKGNDTYTIASVVGTTVNFTSPLSTGYVASSVFRGTVSRVGDKGSLANALTNANPVTRPFFIEGLQNTLSTYKHTASQGTKITAGASGAIANHTAIVVYRNPVLTTNGNGDGVFGAADIFYGIYEYGNTTPTRITYAVGNANEANGIASRDMTNLNSKIMIARNNNTSPKTELWENKQILGRNTSGKSQASFAPQTGADTFNNYSNAEIMEVAFVRRYFTDAELAAVTNLLNNKWCTFRNVSQMTDNTYYNPWRMRYLYGVAATEATAAPTATYDVTAFLGDSISRGFTFIDGSSGNSPGLVPPFTGTITNVFGWVDTAKNLQQITGLTTAGSNTPRNGQSDAQHGPEIHFPYYLSLLTGNPQAVVKYAVGGTTQQAEWDPSGGSGPVQIRDQLVNFFNYTCYRANNDGIFRGWVRNLGINDAINPVTSNYTSAMERMLVYLRDTLGTTRTTRFYNFTQLATSGFPYQADVEAQDTAKAASDPNFLLSTAYISNPSTQTWDGTHWKSVTYDATGQAWAVQASV